MHRPFRRRKRRPARQMISARRAGSARQTYFGRRKSSARHSAKLSSAASMRFIVSLLALRRSEERGDIVDRVGDAARLTGERQLEAVDRLIEALGIGEVVERAGAHLNLLDALREPRTSKLLPDCSAASACAGERIGSSRTGASVVMRFSSCESVD